MAGADFEAEVRNSMRQLQSAIESVGRAQTRATKLTSEAEKAALAAAKAAREHAKAIHEIGGAASRIGGPIGDMISRFTGMQSASAGLTRVAAAASLVGLAITAVTRVIEYNSQKAREAAESYGRMAEAMRTAQQRSLQVGTAGLSQAGVRRQLIAAGPEAEAMAEVMTTSKKYGGLDPNDAAEGTAAIYNKYGPGERAAATAFHARYLAKTGVFSFTEAAQGLIERGGDASVDGLGMAMSARLYAQKTGRRGDPEEAYLGALGNVANDASGYLAGVEDVNGIEGLKQEAERKGVSDRRAGGAARTNLAATKDPTTAAVLDVHNENQRQTAILQKIADAQSGFGAAVSTVLQFFGGAGSGTQQLRRKQIADAGGADAYAP